MPIATPEQYVDALDAAAAGGWALPAINVTSSQTLQAVLRGLAEAGSDGIVQVTTGGAAYLGGEGPAAAEHGAAGLSLFAHEVAADHPSLVALHTDHCPAPQAEAFLGPLLHRSAARRAAGGAPLFASHMFDGSMLPLEENLRASAVWLERCAAAHVLLEVEIGVVGGEEDGVRGDGPGSERLYTTPEDLLRAVDVLGVGEHGRYLLAATFGNVHGVYGRARSTCGPRSSRRDRRRWRRGTRARGSSTSSTARAAPRPSRSARRSVTAWSRSTSTRRCNTRFSAGVADHVTEHADLMASVDGGAEAEARVRPPDVGPARRGGDGPARRRGVRAARQRRPVTGAAAGRLSPLRGSPGGPGSSEAIAQ